MKNIPFQDWLPTSMRFRDLDESPFIRGVFVAVILLWWLDVALFELPLMGILVAVYAFFLTFSVSLAVVATYQVLIQYHAFEKLKRLAHS